MLSTIVVVKIWHVQYLASLDWGRLLVFEALEACGNKGVCILFLLNRDLKCRVLPYTGVGILGLFCPNQVLNPQRHPYTQTWVTCPPPTHGYFRHHVLLPNYAVC